MKKTCIALCMLAVLMVLMVNAGCHGPYKAKSDKKEALEHTETVVLMDKELKKKIRIDAQDASYADDGRLQAYCEIRNRTKKNLVIQVQTVFKDENNLALDDMTNWETIVIPPSAIHYYKTISMTPEARRYGIRIKMGGQR